MFSELLYLSVPFGFGVENLEELVFAELVVALLPEVCNGSRRGTVPSRFHVPSFSVHVFRYSYASLFLARSLYIIDVPVVVVVVVVLSFL